MFVSSVRGMEPIRYCFDSAISRSVGPSVANLASSSSIEATARSTFVGFTPARTISGPGMTFANRVTETAAKRILAKDVVHHPVGVVAPIGTQDRRETVGDVGLRLVHHRQDVYTPFDRQGNIREDWIPQRTGLPPAEHVGG